MSTPVAMIADHIWQSTLVIAVVWILSWLLRANSAAVRHRLWLAASMKFLVPFWFLTQAGSLIEWPSVAVVGDWSRPGQLLSAPFSAEVLSVREAPPEASAGSGGLVVLFAAWATGAVLILGHWWYRWWQLRRIVGQATPVEMRAPIEARLSDGHGPGVFGVVRPVLLVPRGLRERVTLEELDAIVAHETCHVRRRDNLAISVHMIVETLFWFHPLVWWMERRLVDEQERACDETVLAGGTPPRVYAESILKVCEMHRPSLRAWAAGMAARDLNRRIEDIMMNIPRVALSWPKRVALMTSGLAVLAAPILSGAMQTGSQLPPAEVVADWVGTWDMVVREAQIPDPSGRKIGPYPYRSYRIQIEREPDRLRIVNRSQASVSGTVYQEEVVVPLDGSPAPASDPGNAGRTFALRAAGNSFELIRRTPRSDGTIDTMTQRYEFLVSGRLRVTYNSDNPPPAWLIGVLVLERAR